MYTTQNATFIYLFLLSKHVRFICMLSLHFYSGPQKFNVLTIRENGISTYTSPQSMKYPPYNLTQPNQFGFGRSQSYKNYNRYRQNVDNDKRNPSNNVEYHTSRIVSSHDQRHKTLRHDTELDNANNICTLHHQQYMRTPTNLSTYQPIDNSYMR